MSFAIFITFIVFLYTVIKPAVNSGANEKSTLDYLKTKIIENVSSNFTSAGVQINSSVNLPHNCVTLQNFLVFLDILPPYQIIIKNETENIQPAYVIAEDSGDLEINRINRNNLFFKAYSSSEFNGLPINTSLSCSDTDEYSVSSVTTDSYVFEEDVYSFINYYNTNYDQLKTDLKVPAANEFGLDFTQANGTKISVGSSSSSGSVYAEEIPIQYIDDNANILSGFINIRVW